jgi:hypothetical protein
VLEIGYRLKTGAGGGFRTRGSVLKALMIQNEKELLMAITDVRIRPRKPRQICKTAVIALSNFSECAGTHGHILV